MMGVYRCRAIDRRSGEVIREVVVEARSASHARKLAKMHLPNYARIVCEYLYPLFVE